MHDLFEAVRQEILALAPEVREEFTRHYVAYKTHTNFTDIVPQKRRLLLSLNMRFDDISDPRGLAADITNLGLWGNGDVQLEVDNARQIALRDGARATGLRGQAAGRRQGERRLVDSWEGFRGPWSSRTLLNSGRTGEPVQCRWMPIVASARA